MPGNDCPDRQQLMAYACGEVSGVAAQAIALHLGSCRVCQAILQGRDLAHPVHPDEALVAVPPSKDPRWPPELQDSRLKASAAPSAAANTGQARLTAHEAAVLGHLQGYEVQRKLGQGGMGTLFLARQIKLNRLVAIKVLPEHRPAELVAVLDRLLAKKRERRYQTPAQVADAVGPLATQAHLTDLLARAEGRPATGVSPKAPSTSAHCGPALVETHSDDRPSGPPVPPPLPARNGQPPTRAADPLPENHVRSPHERPSTRHPAWSAAHVQSLLRRVPRSAWIGGACAVAVVLLGLIMYVMTDTDTADGAMEREVNGTLINSIGMQFRLMPAGEFPMGSPATDEWRGSVEQPHQVRITQSFYLGVHEVTQERYERVMGLNPSHFRGPQLPVEMVSWEDAVSFCSRLSALPEEKAAGRTYRLPTEAEWEYACRAGSTTPCSYDDDETALSDFAWFHGYSGSSTHFAGGKRRNPWGLHDMHGNVSEWCVDWYARDYYANSPAADPSGPVTGSFRVHRGGSWDKPATFCRSPHRDWDQPDYRSFNLGFRVVAVPSASPASPASTASTAASDSR